MRLTIHTSLIILGVFAGSLFTVPAFSQVKWIRVDSEFGAIPRGIHIYRSTDSLQGRPFLAYYAEVNFLDKKLDFLTDTAAAPGLRPLDFYHRLNNPVLLINCDYYPGDQGESANLIIRKGQILRYNIPALHSRITDSFYYPTRSALGFTKGRKADVAWIFADSAQPWPRAFQHNPIVAKGSSPHPRFEDLRTLDYWEWWHMHTAVGGGPVLIQRGRIRISSREEQVLAGREGEKRPALAMGYTYSNKLIILVIQGNSPGKAEGITLREEAELLRQLHCEEALHIGGAGNACLLINGKPALEGAGSPELKAVNAVFGVEYRPKRKKH